MVIVRRAKRGRRGRRKRELTGVVRAVSWSGILVWS